MLLNALLLEFNHKIRKILEVNNLMTLVRFLLIPTVSIFHAYIETLVSINNYAVWVNGFAIQMNVSPLPVTKIPLSSSSNPILPDVCPGRWITLI